MCLFIRLELLLSVKMDGQRWHLHQRSASIPVLADKLVSLLDDDLASQRQVSIEPCAPETTSVRHHIDLVVAKLLQLAARCDLENGTVSVAPDDLEVVDRLRATLLPSEEGANS